MSTIPTRAQVPQEDTWDLSILFKSREEWEQARNTILESLPKITTYEGRLTEDADTILSLLQELWKLLALNEQVNGYAMLLYSADSSDTQNQELFALSHTLNTQIEQACAFIGVELTNLSEAFLNSLVDDDRFKDFRQQIIQLIRNKQHILSKPEETLIAKQSEYRDGFSNTFSALTDVDMSFGSIDTPEGTTELSHSSIGVLLEHDDREVRKHAYEQYYQEFHSHVHTLSNLYTSNIQQDNAMANIRHYPSALEAALYHDNIPLSLYTGLIERTKAKLPVLHTYYEFLHTQFSYDTLAVYDLRARPFSIPPHDMSFNDAVSLLCKACKPLDIAGDNVYSQVLQKGLSEQRWVDKYENKGKRSGAFSAGIYGGYPYILMNYQSKSLNHVFTLAHEAGHSMHSYYSSHHQPYSQSNYTIFEAEVASTLNEYLMYRYLIAHTDDTTMKTYLLWHEIQDFISTFFRQVMFAEFEKIVHEYAADGNPLTSEFFLHTYEQLSKEYYGPNIHIPDINHITGLRIPHFYRSFYVYKYATGIASAIDIASRIYHMYTNPTTETTSSVLEGYFEFLKSGGSRFPLDSLLLAGVDFTHATPIDNALKEFERQCITLASLCG